MPWSRHHRNQKKGKRRRLCLGIKKLRGSFSPKFLFTFNTTSESEEDSPSLHDFPLLSTVWKRVVIEISFAHTLFSLSFHSLFHSLLWLSIRSDCRSLWWSQIEKEWKETRKKVALTRISHNERRRAFPRPFFSLKRNVLSSNGSKRDTWNWWKECKEWLIFSFLTKLKSVSESRKRGRGQAKMRKASTLVRDRERSSGVNGIVVLLSDSSLSPAMQMHEDFSFHQNKVWHQECCTRNE